jgi:hypothetical protein
LITVGFPEAEPEIRIQYKWFIWRIPGDTKREVGKGNRDMKDTLKGNVTKQIATMDTSSPHPELCQSR